MQTFLPYPDLKKSVESLDNKRLGKQRVEAMQLLKALRGQTKGWRNHPAAKMWQGFESGLSLYMNLCIEEWKRRGFKNTMVLAVVEENPPLPDWFGREDFHRSHQSNLVRKDANFYGPQFPGVPADLPYIWPV